MSRGVVLAALAVLAAGCAGQRGGDIDLALHCQVKACECRPAKLSLFKKSEKVPVQWRANGDAYCPETHVLTPLESAGSEFRSRYGG